MDSGGWSKLHPAKLLIFSGEKRKMGPNFGPKGQFLGGLGHKTANFHGKRALKASNLGQIWGVHSNRDSPSPDETRPTTREEGS